MTTLRKGGGKGKEETPKGPGGKRGTEHRQRTPCSTAISFQRPERVLGAARTHRLLMTGTTPSKQQAGTGRRARRAHRRLTVRSSAAQSSLVRAAPEPANLPKCLFRGDGSFYQRT